MHSKEIEAVRFLTERLLSTNLRKGYDLTREFEYSYVRPSSKGDKWQWFWDSCFHSIAIAHVDPNQAKRELETLVATQAEDGFIGHKYYWGVRFGGYTQPWAIRQSRHEGRLTRSGIIHPPVLAQAVERVGHIIQDAAFPPPFMHALDAYHEWLDDNRAPDADGLLVIISPYESGVDQSPAYDEARGVDGRSGRWRQALRDRLLGAKNWASGYDSAAMLSKANFYVKDAMVNGLYADSLATMARMHKAQGNMEFAQMYAARAELVTESLLEKMLDRSKGGFLSLIGREERRIEPLTVGGLVPLMVGGMPADIVTEIIERHLLSREKFWLRYPLPSVAANEPSFNPRETRMEWRGPTWVNTNWLVWRGLRRHGHAEAADQLASRTVGLVARSGLREFYNPLSGAGMGAKDFGSSALALDMAA